MAVDTVYGYVLEISPTIDAAGTTQTFRFGTQGWSTGATETPAATVIPGLIVDPGTYEIEMFAGARVTGAARASFGAVVLDNSRGTFDGWGSYGIAGARVVMWFGPLDQPFPSAWSQVYVARAHRMVRGLQQVQLEVRDRMQLLDKAIVTDVVNGPAGSSSKAPLCFGFPGFVPLVLEDDDLHIYRVHDNATDAYALAGIDVYSYVYVGGIKLLGPNPLCETEATFRATAPAVGYFSLWGGSATSGITGVTGPVRVRLPEAPKYDPRYGARGFLRNGVDDTLHTWTLHDLCNRAGLDDVDTTGLQPGWTVLSVGNRRVADDETYLEVMEDRCRQAFQFFGFDRLDRFFTSRVVDPATDAYSGETDMVTLSETNAAGFSIDTPEDLEAPVGEITVRAGETWPSSLDPNCDDVTRDVLSRRVETVFTATFGGAKIQYPGAISSTVELTGALFYRAGDAARLDFATAYAALYAAPRQLLTATLKRFDQATLANATRIGGRVRVTLASGRMGLGGSGQVFRAARIRLLLRDRQIEYGLWGGPAGNTAGIVIGGAAGTPSIGGGSRTGKKTSKGLVQVGRVKAAARASLGAVSTRGQVQVGRVKARASASINADPYFSSVVLLMHCDAGSPWVDSSSLGATLTASGTITASTSSPLVGAASMVPGTNGKVNTPTSATYNIGSGDLTVELTLRLSATPNTERLFEIGGAGIQIWFNGSTLAPTVLAFGGTVFTASALATSTTYHIALVKSGTTYTLYANGTSIGTGTRAGTDDGTTARTIAVGNFDAGTQPAVSAKLDEIRVTKGVARYSGTFTPPTTPY